VGKIGQTPPIMACKKKPTQTLQQSTMLWQYLMVEAFNGCKKDTGMLYCVGIFDRF